MSLTGVPLLVAVAFATVAAAAVTAAGWRRLRRHRLLLRVVGVLVTEALVLLTVGLTVNRSDQFYPSWNALVGGSPAGPDAVAAGPGRLDRWLGERYGGRQGQPASFAWRPSGWTAWRLAGPPTVVVPPDYLRHPSWRYPAVLVVTGPHDGRSDAADLATAQSAGSAVLVFVRAGPSVAPGTLATALPQDLMNDLRVTAHSWAIVASAAEAELARRTVLAEPGRYPALALLRSGPGQPSTPAATPGARRPPDRAQHGGSHVPAGLPAGVTVALVGGPDSGPGTAGVVRLPAGSTTGLRTALVWACGQTPAPLAEAAPLTPPHPDRLGHRMPHPSMPPRHP